MAEELGISGRNEICQKLLGRAATKIQQQNNNDIGANVASGSYTTDAMIVLAVQHGHAGPHRQWHGEQSDRARRRRVPEGAPAADFVCARDALQPNPSPQHDPGRRSRCDDFSCHTRPSIFILLPPKRSHASSSIACWRMSGCRSPERTVEDVNETVARRNGQIYRSFEAR